MELNEYQEKAKKTAKYKNKKEELILTTLGLAGETGEVVEKIKNWEEIKITLLMMSI